MTTEITTPNAPAPTDASLDQIASAREHWVSLGYSAEAFDHGMAGPPVGSEAPADAEPVEVLGGAHTPVLDAAQALEMADALRAAGVPEADIQAALAADGFAPAPEDTRTDEQKGWDAMFGGAKPSEYRVNYMGRMPADMDPGALAEFNTAATTWASEVGFDASLGAGVIERAVDVGRATRAMSEGERTLSKREQAAEFERQAGGPDQAAAKMKLAAQALSRGPREFTELLRQNGALDDAWAILTLSNLAERMAART